MKEIKLGGKLGKGLFVMVDDEDYEWLSKYTWWCVGNEKSMYPAAMVGGVRVFMHRLILGVTDRWVHGDHKDNNTFNCQRGNLRPATCAENMRNKGVMSDKKSSKYKGVFRNRKSWSATIMANNIRYHLGTYETEIEAAIAYNEGVLIHHGKYAQLNEISEVEKQGVVLRPIVSSTSRNGKTSQFKGVYWEKEKSRWKAIIGCNGKKYWLGSYINEIDAAIAYNRKAAELLGHKARLNPIEDSQKEIIKSTLAGPKRRFKQSSSKYRGVRWVSASNKWRAVIWSNGKGIHLGNFNTEKEAAHAYNKKAKEIHGDIAILNTVE